MGTMDMQYYMNSTPETYVGIFDIIFQLVSVFYILHYQQWIAAYDSYTHYFTHILYTHHFIIIL